MSKYYAVKEGRKIGIFSSWAECQAQVEGYSGAVFKKFASHEEARNFIAASGDTVVREDIADVRANEIIAYVDGSFHQESGYYSYGVVCFTEEGKSTYKEKENDENFAAMRNVAGEIRGAMVAMEKALDLGKDTLYLHYDYMGIEKWAKEEWKANKYGTQSYRDFYKSIKDQLEVIFIKVKAHSGDRYNEEADQLAKSALGIEA